MAAAAPRLGAWLPGLLAGLVLASPGNSSCTPGPETLCLLEGRLRVEVDWRNQHDGGSTGAGRALPGSDRSGSFWFFDPDNIELVVKALDGRPLNGHFWIFYGALSDVEYWIRVTDTATGAVRSFHNPPGNLCGEGETRAFAAMGMPAAARARKPEEGLSEAPTRRPLPAGTRGSCTPGPETLCLLEGRLRVEVDWRNQHDGGSTGAGRALPGSDRSGSFWFFDPDNIELVVKALDGRPLNGRLWIFYGALSDVEYWIRVTDTATGAERTYHNPPGNLCGFGDTAAFCDEPGDCGLADGRLLLASTPVQGKVGDSLLFAFRPLPLADDVDVVSLHQDFYGIPWQAFARGQDPPRSWARRIEEAAALAAGWGKPIYLSLALVQGGSRAYLADRAVPSPDGLRTESEWSRRCFNFATDPDGPKWRQAYLR